FKELKQASKVSFNHQKELLEYEFKAIYGGGDSLSYDEKSHAIQLMKSHQIKLPLEEIKSDFHSQKEEQNKYYTPAWKQARDTLFTLRIYNRTLNKMERNSKENKTPQE